MIAQGLGSMMGGKNKDKQEKVSAVAQLAPSILGSNIMPTQSSPTEYGISPTFMPRQQGGTFKTIGGMSTYESPEEEKTVTSGPYIDPSIQTGIGAFRTRPAWLDTLMNTY